MTGVSKFSKVSLFSGLNNLNDITLDAPYAAICGYTDHDINTVFASELPGLDCEEIRAGTTATAGAESTSILKRPGYSGDRFV